MRKSLGGGLPKLALGLFAALVVLLGLATGLGLREALADDVSVLGNGVNSPSAKIIKLGGKKWQVVGHKGTGVAQSSGAQAPSNNTVTLLLEESEMPQEDTKFSNSSSNHYGGSILQEKMTNIYNGFSPDEKSVIAARDLIGGGTYDSANPQNFCDKVSDSSTVTGQHLWPLSSYESIKELDRAIRFSLSDWWLRSPGNSSDRVAYYSCMYDNVADSGQEANDCSAFVRPACYVNLDAVGSVEPNGDGTYRLVPKPPHTHNFSYSVNSTGETITAECKNPDCPLTENPTLSINAPANTTYDGTAKAATLSTGYDTTAFPGPYTIVYKQGDQELASVPVNVGTYTASVTVGEGDNAVTAIVGYSITKAPAPTIENVQILQLVGAKETYEISHSVAGVMPSDAGSLRYATAGQPSQTGDTFTVSDFAVSEGGVVSAKVTYTDLAKPGDQVTLPVKITSANYADTTVNVIVKLTVKPVTTVTLDPTSVSNKTYGDGDFTVTASVTNKGTGDATWTWYSSDDTVLQVLSTQNTENGGSKATVHILKPGSAMIAAVYETTGEESGGTTTGAVIGAAVTNAITVAKRPLTIAANSPAGIYVGGEVPALDNVGYTVGPNGGGLANGDSLSGLTLAYSPEATSAAPGTFAIVPSGASVLKGNADVTGYYDITYQNGSLTVNPKMQQTITAEDVTVTYGDTEKAVVGQTDGGGTISYSVMNGSGDFIDVDASTGALTVKKVPTSGKAYVIVTAAGTEAYEEATKSVTVTINKADAVPATVAPNNRAYDGTARPLVNVTGEATGGTMLYSIGNANYSKMIPTGTRVGEYNVLYKVVGDENHNDSEVQQIGVTISKAPAPIIQPIQIVLPVGAEAAYDIEQSVAGVMPTDAGNLTYATAGQPSQTGDTFTVSDFAVSEDGVVSAKVTYTDSVKPDDQVTLPVKITSANYADTTVNVVAKLTLKAITDVKFDPTPDSNKTYGDSNFDVKAIVMGNGGAGQITWTWYSSDESVLKVTAHEPPEANSSKATVQVLKPGSAIIAAMYETTGEGGSGAVIGAAMTDSITVAKRPLTIKANGGIVRVGGEVPALPASPEKDKDYTVEGLLAGDSVTVPTLSYQKGGAEVTPTSATPDTFDIVPSGATVFKGDADVTANYNIAYQNGALEIKEKDAQTITAENVTVTFGNAGRNVAATTDGDGSLSYAVKPGSEAYIGVDASTGVLTTKKAGTATVIVTATGTADYEAATKEVTVTINKANAVPATVAASNRIYDGTAKPLVTVTGEATGGTMQYSTDGRNFSDKIPTATEANTYAVWYKVAGDENHNDTEPVRVTSTISKKDDPKAVVPTAKGHVQDKGDVGGQASGNVATVGTTGQSKRLESFSLSLPAGTDGGIEYRGHVQDKGWDSWVAGGKTCGTTGQSKRLEAVQMRLTGNLAKTHSVWYRTHAQDRGTLGWARDGQAAGTAGQSLRLEQVEVCVLPKGQTPDGYAEGAASFVGAAAGMSHVQNVGWAAAYGTALGTTGLGLRMEALSLNAPSLPEACGIAYEAHVEGVGWQGARENGRVAGTEGQARRVEAVRVSLTGEAARSYSVWYRVHSQDYGWLGWAKDGKDAGTTGLSKRAEAMQVLILPQGQIPTGYDAGKQACVTK